MDGNDQTVVTVLLPDTSPAKGLNVAVSDAKDNHAAKDTDKNGQITVPDAAGSAGEIIGTDTGDADQSNTVNVDVADQDGKPVDGAEIAVDEDGEVSVALPDGFDFDEDGPVTVTVTDNQDEAKSDVPVAVTDGTGTVAAGETDGDGAVTLPDEYHFAYIVGYTDGTVGPDRNMTRAEAAAVFARILSETRGEALPDGRSSRFPMWTGTPGMRTMWPIWKSWAWWSATTTASSTPRPASPGSSSSPSASGWPIGWTWRPMKRTRAPSRM